MSGFGGVLHRAWDVGLTFGVLELAAYYGRLRRPKTISMFGNNGIINNTYGVKSDDRRLIVLLK